MSYTEFNSGTISEYDNWQIFVKRIPNDFSKYCLLLGRNGSEIMFYSRGVAWDENSETRTARPVNSASVIQYYNAKKVPILVLETPHELDMWIKNWTTVALVESTVWQELERDLD